MQTPIAKIMISEETQPCTQIAGADLLQSNGGHPEGVYRAGTHDESLRVLVENQHGQRRMFNARHGVEVKRKFAESFNRYVYVPNAKATVTIAGWTKTVGGG